MNHYMSEDMETAILQKKEKAAEQWSGSLAVSCNI